jgi:hypothetical protein
MAPRISAVTARTKWACLCVFASTFIEPAHAEPWLHPGDAALRADILLLADAGILRGPVTTWPISWPDLARDVLAIKDEPSAEATRRALIRVRHRVQEASSHGASGIGIRVSGASSPRMLRDFSDDPREEGELTLRAGWLSDHFAVNLQGTYVADADDGKSFRPDGSYLGVSLGNFMLSAGFMDRWWGPGWDNSLILSTNARPIPGITLDRNYSDPFDSKWLSWIGPWRVTVAMGRAESSDAPVPDVRFFASRVNFRPRDWLEFGLTRTAQWCGGDRTCDWSTFLNMVFGRDNQTANGAPASDQPGNQMAGYDVRVRSPYRALPLAFYTQWIGEDEAGGLPSKFIGQFGLETWGTLAFADWRLRAEYNDTTCNFLRHAPEYNCAYRNGLYPQGYAYRGRIIGSSMDNDSRMFTIAGLLTRPGGDTISLALRRAEINRDGGDHSISSVPLDVDNVELRYSRGFGPGQLSVGFGYEDPSTQPHSSSVVHGFITWQQGF